MEREPSAPASNRAMLLTPPGAAAIAVIRIVGPRAVEFLAKHFSRPLTPLRAVHGDLRDGESVIDDPVIVLSPDQTSADINVHGGPWVVESVFQLLAREEFQRTQPSVDDFDAPTLLEREMLASLPLAKTEPALRMLLAQPAAWRGFIAAKASPDAIRALLDDVCLRRLLHPPRVAIIGPPNVGKSTLANQLFAQQRSITADMPGTTRDWVGEIANIDGLPVILVDTPGLRKTDDAIEREAIDRSRDIVQRADVVLRVIAPAERGDELLILDEPAHENTIDILNKFDVLRSRGLAVGIDVICTVATTGEGIDWVRAAIRNRLGCRDLQPNRPRWWTDRQRDILRRALDDVTSLAEI